VADARLQGSNVTIIYSLATQPYVLSIESTTPQVRNRDCF